MPKLKILSGKDLVAIFQNFGFEIAAQKGSHIKLARAVDGRRQTLTAPNHKEIDKGTLKAIYNQALRYISDTELKPHFYCD